MPLLRRFKMKIQNNRSRIRCPHCNELLIISQYERHVQKNHSLNILTACAFCYGAKTWKRFQKSANLPHLEVCYQKFLKERKLPKVKPMNDDFILNDDRDVSLCPVRDRLGHYEVPFEHAYDPIFQEIDPSLYKLDNPNVIPNRITFQGNIEIARRYMELYAHTNHYAHWYHCIVKAAAFPSFYKNMNTLNHKAFTLPFWCWCSGGKHERCELNYHRHMILVVHKKIHFRKNVWNKIQNTPFHFDGFEPLEIPTNYRNKKLIQIKHWMHLVNTIVYVSNRHSQSNNALEPDMGNDSTQHYHHHSIDMHTPSSLTRKSLAAYYEENGLIFLVKHQHQANNLMDFCVYMRSGWYIKVFYLVADDLYDVLPVAKKWKPVGIFQQQQVQQHRPQYDVVLHLADGMVLVFEEDPQLETLSDSEWNTIQVQNENQFYKIIQGAYVRLNRPQQRIMTSVHSVRYHLKNKYDELLKQRDTEINKLQNIIRILKEDSLPHVIVDLRKELEFYRNTYPQSMELVYPNRKHVFENINLKNERMKRMNLEFHIQRIQKHQQLI